MTSTLAATGAAAAAALRARAPPRVASTAPAPAPAPAPAKRVASVGARRPMLTRVDEIAPSSPISTRRVAARAKGDGVMGDAEDLMRKYGDAASATGQFIGKQAGMKGGGAPARRARSSRDGNGDGVFALLLVNVAAFVADNWLRLPVMRALYLNHMHPQWWQFVTSIFCHANWAHLSGNIFFLYVFGRIVEEEEGTFGVWFSYLFTGVGAGVASYLVLPKAAGGMLGLGAAATVSLGASGAVFGASLGLSTRGARRRLVVFSLRWIRSAADAGATVPPSLSLSPPSVRPSVPPGLFAISVLTKMKMNFRKLLEAVILGQFVIERFLSEARMASAAGGVGAGGVNHVAHLGAFYTKVFHPSPGFNI